MSAGWTSLCYVYSDAPFAQSTPRYFDAADWIIATVAHEMGVPESDLELIEDDGIEYVTLRGGKVVEVCFTYRPSNTARHPTLIAAE